MTKVRIHIENLNLNYPQKSVLRDLNWIIKTGEHWCLTGMSGSGKTVLAKAIAGLIKTDGKIEINFCSESRYTAQALLVESWYQFKNLEGQANFYYQQRYTSLQANDTLTVHAELLSYGKANQLDLHELEHLLVALNFSALASSQLLELSSGEHKKLQLIKALWLKPQILIIDQPYTGLDIASRKNLNIHLDEIAAKGIMLILICNELELPHAINRFAEIRAGQLYELDSRITDTTLPKEQLRKVPDFLRKPPIYSSKAIVKMVNVCINYGEKQVLKNINWEVEAGDKWLLQGHNGSGKSTLLSLLNGDHPQSYANELYLFGNKRGTGESVWEIKERIGLISPEFHWYFDSSSTVWQSIASGFYDTVGLFQQLPYTKSEQVDQLITYFGLTEYKNEYLNTLPLGKQRLVLLARTIIKNPELLILDEPCQGLDQQQTIYFNQLVDELCNNGMTLIYVGHFDSQLPSKLTHRLLLNQGEVLENTKTQHIQTELAS